MQLHLLLQQPSVKLSLAAFGAIPKTPESVNSSRVGPQRQEEMRWRQRARVMEEKKNHISLTQNETDAQVVNITSNYLP